MAIFGTILAATLSTGVEIPDGGVPVNDGGRQYTVRIDKEATARCLTVRDCRMANELDERIPFIENLGKVEVLTRENNDFAGEWKSLGERMCESRRFTSRAVASRAE